MRALYYFLTMLLLILGSSTIFAQSNIGAQTSTFLQSTGVVQGGSSIPVIATLSEGEEVSPLIDSREAPTTGSTRSQGGLGEKPTDSNGEASIGKVVNGSTENDGVMSIQIKGVGVDLKVLDNALAQSYVDKINAFIRSLTPSQIGQIPPNDFGKIPPSGIALLNANQTRAITASQIQSLSGDQAMQLSSGQIKEFFTTLDEKDFDIIYSQLTRKQIRDFVVRLSPKEISSLSTYQLSKLDLDIFSKLSSQQFNAFSEKQVTAFTTSQVNSFTDNQLYWSYSKLGNGMQRANFIRILNKEQLAAIIKFLPKSSYAKVFNDANPRVLASLINAVNDGEKEFIVGRLNSLMISQIYSELPEIAIAKLRPDQKTYLTEGQLVTVAQE